jgi:hypothetical protein
VNSCSLLRRVVSARVCNWPLPLLFNLNWRTFAKCLEHSICLINSRCLSPSSGWLLHVLSTNCTWLSSWEISWLRARVQLCPLIWILSTAGVTACLNWKWELEPVQFSQDVLLGVPESDATSVCYKCRFLPKTTTQIPCERILQICIFSGTSGKICTHSSLRTIALVY